jgi:hypothetical protein
VYLANAAAWAGDPDFDPDGGGAAAAAAAAAADAISVGNEPGGGQGDIGGGGGGGGLGGLLRALSTPGGIAAAAAVSEGWKDGERWRVGGIQKPCATDLRAKLPSPRLTLFHRFFWGG